MPAGDRLTLRSWEGVVTSRSWIAAPELRRRMRRREFILGLAMLTNAHGASAQSRVRRVGALVVEQIQANILETVLKQKGWILGRNLEIEYRLTRGDTDLSRAHARELLALQPDVLFAVSNTSMAALHAEHSGIP